MRTKTEQGPQGKLIHFHLRSRCGPDGQGVRQPRDLGPGRCQPGAQRRPVTALPFSPPCPMCCPWRQEAPWPCPGSAPAIGPLTPIHVSLCNVYCPLDWSPPAAGCQHTPSSDSSWSEWGMSAFSCYSSCTWSG